jgi:hypothetical protein
MHNHCRSFSLSQKSIFVATPKTNTHTHTMKFGAAFVALALAVAQLLPTLVHGDVGVVVVLNGNKDDPPAVTCTATEKNTIDIVIQAAASARRQLGVKGLSRKVVAASEEGEEMPRGRKLNCPTGCGPYCWGSGTGCPGGMGRRNRRVKESKAASRRHVRKTREQQPDQELERQLPGFLDSTSGGVGGGIANPGVMTPLPMTMDTCRAKIPTIHAALNALQPSLTPPCQALLSAPRNITCQEFTTDCDIKLVKMVSTDESSMQSVSVSSSPTGKSFCQSEGISFEAATKFSVGLVHFVVSAPTGVVYNRTATKAPYYFNGENALGPKGVTFPLGTYTMTITSDYEPLSSKSFAFTVKNC